MNDGIICSPLRGYTWVFVVLINFLALDIIHMAPNRTPGKKVLIGLFTSIIIWAFWLEETTSISEDT